MLVISLVILPKLGDGRALLLGEIKDTCGKRHDIQLRVLGERLFRVMVMAKLRSDQYCANTLSVRQ